MKANKIFGVVAVVLFGILTGCSSRFLDNEPTGDTVSQKQFDENLFSLEANVRGLYKLMITYSNHDVFGQKSIDIKTDMLSSDMALTNIIYGWFSSCGMLQEYYPTSSLTGYLWNYYYTIIKNCNLIIKVKGDTDLSNPATASEQLMANYIGQAYAMRGYAYYCMSYYYAVNQFKTDNVASFFDAPCVPIYDEYSSDVEAQPLATVGQVIDFAESDLLLAVNYLKNYSRESKTMVDKDVASVFLAYLYLYRARKTADNNQKDADIAACLDLCSNLISGGKYPVLSLAEVTTTGFNNITSKNWMWGQDITAETTTALGSFWGQMDIFTYSYAFAGDVKAVDEDLYKEWETSHPTDSRLNWWSPNYQGYKYAPTGKFYNNEREVGGDRIWLNDIVFMRSEEIYLIAAEAATLKSDYVAAAGYLKPLLEQRDPTVAASLTADESIKEEILYNWRIEMWGEGKTFFTIKRFDHAIKRGPNHRFLKNKDVSAYSKEVCFSIPSSEVKYNPYLSE
jgi:hypothetical protein